MKAKMYIVTIHADTLPPHHTSIMPLTPKNYRSNIQTNTLLGMEANPFFLIEKPNITIIPALMKLDSRTPDKFMAILWRSGGQSISIKNNMTIGYIKESEYIKKSQIDQQENIREAFIISQDKLPPMPEKSALHFITTSTQNQK